jgi:hypothetical protein
MTNRIKQQEAPARSKVRRWMRLHVDQHATATDLSRGAQAAFGFPEHWLDDEFHWIHDEAFAVIHRVTVIGATSLWARTREHACGAITALGTSNSDWHGQRSDCELIGFLQFRGYALTRVAASYLENAGDSGTAYFVCNGSTGDDQGRLEADLQKLGAHFRRDLVLIIPCGGIGASLLGTTRRTDASLGFGEKRAIEANEHSAAHRFLTLLRGREVRREIVPRPGTLYGRWAQHLTAKELEQRWQSGETVSYSGPAAADQDRDAEAHETKAHKTHDGGFTWVPPEQRGGPPRKVESRRPLLWLARNGGQLYLVNDSGETLDVVIATSGGFFTADELVGTVASESAYRYEHVQPGTAVKVDEYDGFYDLDYVLQVCLTVQSPRLGQLDITSPAEKGGVGETVLLWDSGEAGKHAGIKRGELG